MYLGYKCKKRRVKAQTSTKEHKVSRKNKPKSHSQTQTQINPCFHQPSAHPSSHHACTQPSCHDHPGSSPRPLLPPLLSPPPAKMAAMSSRTASASSNQGPRPTSPALNTNAPSSSQPAKPHMQKFSHKCRLPQALSRLLSYMLFTDCCSRYASVMMVDSLGSRGGDVSQDIPQGSDRDDGPHHHGHVDLFVSLRFAQPSPLIVHRKLTHCLSFFFFPASSSIHHLSFYSAGEQNATHFEPIIAHHRHHPPIPTLTNRTNQTGVLGLTRAPTFLSKQTRRLLYQPGRIRRR